MVLLVVVEQERESVVVNLTVNTLILTHTFSMSAALKLGCTS